MSHDHMITWSHDHMITWSHDFISYHIIYHSYFTWAEVLITSLGLRKGSNTLQSTMERTSACPWPVSHTEATCLSTVAPCAPLSKCPINCNKPLRWIILSHGRSILIISSLSECTCKGCQTFSGLGPLPKKWLIPGAVCEPCLGRTSSCFYYNNPWNVWVSKRFTMVFHPITVG